jgi:hypothetical protein
MPNEDEESHQEKVLSGVRDVPQPLSDVAVKTWTPYGATSTDAGVTEKYVRSVGWHAGVIPRGTPRTGGGPAEPCGPAIGPRQGRPTPAPSTMSNARIAAVRRPSR